MLARILGPAECGADSWSITYERSGMTVPLWRLANVFANGKLYTTCDVPEANRLPQGLEPSAQPAPKAAKPHTQREPASQYS